MRGNDYGKGVIRVPRPETLHHRALFKFRVCLEQCKSAGYSNRFASTRDSGICTLRVHGLGSMLKASLKDIKLAEAVLKLENGRGGFGSTYRLW